MAASLAPRARSFSPRGPAELREVAAGVHAYLQQGSWGFSNAGLIADGDASLLVDTLYDLKLTGEMLAAMRRAVPAAKHIGTLVNTHANGDHCWGNQLVGSAKIVSTKSTAQEMLELKPAVMAAMLGAAKKLAELPAPARKAAQMLGRVGVPRVGPLAEAADFVERCFGSFEFRGIDLTLPTETFEGTLSLKVGDVLVELIEVGPAHTKGDLLVWLPKQRVVFTGDILFIGMHPIIWAGPIASWIAACDRILALEPQVIVPGHGPLTDASGVRETKAYWEHILNAARAGRDAGKGPDEVARELLHANSGPFAEANEAHRLVVNLDTAYRDLAGEGTPRDPLALFARMAELERAL